MVIMKYIQAAEKNFPVVGIIGEYQISLDNATRTYPEYVINCNSRSCKAKCGVPKQALNRLTNSELSNSLTNKRVLEYPDTKITMES